MRRRYCLLFISLVGLTVSAPTFAACDRDCLVGHLDAYLAALVTNDPSPLPLADSVRFTENTNELAVGDGFWKTATALGDYQIYTADPVTGQAAFIGEVKEGEASMMLALRLLVVNDEITEIETIKARTLMFPGAEVEAAPRPTLNQTIPAEQRLSREQMIATVNTNFDGILNDDGSIHAPDCQRVENRLAMSGNPQLNYPIATLPDIPKPQFGAMSCREQIESHLFDTFDAVEPRRMLVLDEEKQIVFGIYAVRLYGQKKCNSIPNYGEVCPAREPDPVSLLSAEILGVRGGQIHEVEVVFIRADYDTDTGWN